MPASKATADPVSTTSGDRPRNKSADSDDQDNDAALKTQVIAALDLTAQEPSHASKPVKESRSTLTSDEARELLEHGDRLMQLGDIVSARSLYARALSADRANAALRLGSTYDPLIYERIGVRGLRADTAKALEWYLTAAKAGNANARQAHEALKAFNSQ
jgi:TPR repeat protein